MSGTAINLAEEDYQKNITSIVECSLFETSMITLGARYSGTSAEMVSSKAEPEIEGQPSTHELTIMNARLARVIDLLESQVAETAPTAEADPFMALAAALNPKP